ncbi:unnamed protein product [Gadus morhua 'NCC']
MSVWRRAFDWLDPNMRERNHSKMHRANVQEQLEMVCGRTGAEDPGAGLRSGRSGGSRAFKVNSLSGGAHAEEDPMGEGSMCHSHSMLSDI